nr:hypothetical protein [Rathayibacter toxicus]
MSAEAFFEPWEKSANSWTSSQAAIKNVLDLGTDRRDLAWRGVANSSYALHSSLYRRFMTANGVPPDEDDLVSFENNLCSQPASSGDLTTWEPLKSWLISSTMVALLGFWMCPLILSSLFGSLSSRNTTAVGRKFLISMGVFSYLT